MKHTAFLILLVTAVMACDEPTQPVGPSATMAPAVSVSAAAEFRVRNLGTLGGTFSNGIGINERTEVVRPTPMVHSALRSGLR
jgi:hypothetical protein